MKKTLFFLALTVVLALPLACANRVFNEPISPIVAPTPTPTAAWGYPSGSLTPTATPP